MEIYNVPMLLRARTDQKSFHVASEQNVRVEFRNMVAGEVLPAFRYAGDIVLTCFGGGFRLEADEEAVDLGVLDQAVIPAGQVVRMACESSGTVQFIWCPSFGEVTMA